MAVGEFGLSAVVTGAFLDSMNSCALGVSVILLALLLLSFRDGRDTLVAGLSAVAGVFVVYVMAGLGFLSAVQSPSVSYAFYWTLIFLLSLGGAALLYSAWAVRNVPLFSATFSSTAGLAVSGFVVGAVLGAFQLPCTGQVYMSILALINASGAGIGTLLLWLLLYNLVFVTPLLGVSVVVAALHRGGVMESRSNRRVAYGLLGLLFYSMAVFYAAFTVSQLAGIGPTRPLGFAVFALNVILWGYLIYRSV